MTCLGLGVNFALLVALYEAMGFSTKRDFYD